MNLNLHPVYDPRSLRDSGWRRVTRLTVVAVIAGLAATAGIASAVAAAAPAPKPPPPSDFDGPAAGSAIGGLGGPEARPESAFGDEHTTTGSS
jgi:hypothetical protein